MPGYEKAGWGPGGFGTELVPFTDWEIGMLMTRHHDDCAVRVELRRSAHAGDGQERRLEQARGAACTCGARALEGNNAPIVSSVSDQRDNRDPEAVGQEYLNRAK